MGQNMKIFLSVFQNGSFYIAKWPVLPFRMIHFVEQNGPFSRAE
jgi:hypothetical protein